MGELPGSVLFACSMNAIRSPMAETIMKSLFGRRVYVDSVGVRAGEPDGFAISVLDEIGLDMSRHDPKTFGDLEDDYFDLVISLSPEAHHRAIELTRQNACDVEYWPMPDASLAGGNREQRLEAYRELRERIMDRILDRFPQPRGPVL